MNTARNELFAGTAMNERALPAFSFAVYGRPHIDLGPSMALSDHGLAPFFLGARGASRIS
jgi:hypothetical protein